jgi:hypothetical protein
MSSAFLRGGCLEIVFGATRCLAWHFQRLSDPAPPYLQAKDRHLAAITLSPDKHIAASLLQHSVKNHKKAEDILASVARAARALSNFHWYF